MDLEEYKTAGRWHGGIAGVITFLGGWIYCTCQYGFLLGFGLGWLASGILGFIAFIVIGWLWLPIDIGLIVLCYIVYNAVHDTKPTASQSPQADVSPIAPLDKKQVTDKRPTLADLQVLRKKQSEKVTLNNLPPPKQTTKEPLTNCLMAAANTYQIPPAILIGIMQVEDGHVGEETKPDPDYLYFMGPMHISNRMIPEVAHVWKVDFDTAHDWLKNDGCVNVYVAGWVLAQKLAESGNLYQAIGLYHSNDPAAASSYTKKVIDAMDAKGLINHDAPLRK